MLHVQQKYRGTKKNKFAWATEQNEGREIYLSHYHGVDSFDHMINTTGNTCSPRSKSLSLNIE
jgi:hypothetical protein